jgi:hypothetical protein
MEWYPLSPRTEVYNGKAAMDCPWCRHPVVFDRKTETLSPAPLDLPVYRRDENLATITATLLGYPSLEAFLVDPNERTTATPFRFRYWPNIYLPLQGKTP